MYERTYHTAVLKGDKKDLKQPRRINWKAIAWSVGAAAAMVGMILLIRLPHVQVNTVEVTGTNVAYPGDVSEFVRNQLQGNKLWILPKSSMFLVPTHKLEQDIKTAFPRFQTVNVKRKNFSTLVVTVSEYQGVYLWCTDANDCYFMDQNGMVFAAAPYFSGDAYPKIFIGTLQPIPFQVVTKEQVSSIGTLIDHLRSLGIVASEFHYIGDHELDVYFIHNGQQATLLLDPTVDTNDSLSTLFTGLQTEPLATKFHTATNVLQYIDLRFPDRVVYKFQ